MTLTTLSLASGSNGNCYYISNGEEAILIDAGISCRETERRMSALSLSLQKIKAIFISHEHIDHIKGVEVLSRKYNIPVYITPRTLSGGRLTLDTALVHDFAAYEPVRIGELEVLAFPKNHDAADPHSFIIQAQQTKVGVFTDIGEPCDHVIRQFQECQVAFLETNYDEEMLERGRYPYHLKKRIAGPYGHLSNAQALKLFTEHRSEALQCLFLSHLSKDNNCPELAARLFAQHAGSTKIVVASRYQASELFQVSPSTTYFEYPAPMVQAALF